ncbi:MAG: hypothetical protein WC435_00780 [Candidatus Paceibacterota bacterium]
MTEVNQKRICQECGNEMVDVNYCNYCNKRVISNLHVFISENIEISEAYKGKVREGQVGEVKPHFEFSEKDEKSGDSRLTKGVHISIAIDRKNNKYRQVVKDKRTGKILHKESEPLTEHRSKKLNDF